MKTYADWAETHEVHSGREAWRAAIQSLGVTPELVAAARDGMVGESDYAPGYGGYVGDDAMRAAVTAVITAIKEQS